MRGVLTAILILFITSSCFALKPEPPKLAYHSVSEKKVTALTRFFNKIHQEEQSSLSQDEFEHPSLIRQLLKKVGISSIQLFHHPEYGAIQPEAVQLYTANAQTNYNFIFHFLYPKHVFW